MVEGEPSGWLSCLNLIQIRSPVRFWGGGMVDPVHYMHERGLQESE